MTVGSPTRYSRYAAAGIALLAWYGLLLQLYVVIITARSTGVPVATAIVNYFSFFTILTNLLVALVLTLSLRPQASSLNRFCARPTVQSATAVYIAIVGVVYSLALRNIWGPEGLQKVADVVLHDATPVLYVLYCAWLISYGCDKDFHPLVQPSPRYRAALSERPPLPQRLLLARAECGDSARA